jgi:precorrin-6A/cobalt-precorrin-6A reductase
MAEDASLVILGGTTEAVSLAEAANANMEGLRVITSLAGVTKAPAQNGETRKGGFGGAAGMEAYLRTEKIALVIDATHPFANTISDNAERASKAAGIPLLHLVRPAWRRRDGDGWIEVADVATAAAALPGAGRRAFLTVGSRDLSHFNPVEGVWFLIRTIEKPARPLPGNDSVAIRNRGPFDEASERELMARHDIDVVVARNSGAQATYGKIAAARGANIPVVMVRRPIAPTGESVETVEEALEWLKRRLEQTKM